MSAAPGFARRAAGRLAPAGALLACALGAASCGPEGPRPIRLWTQTYEFRVTADPSPPRAGEPTRYRVEVGPSSRDLPLAGTIAVTP